MTRRCAEGQIVAFVREADAGVQVKDLDRTHGLPEWCDDLLGAHPLGRQVVRKPGQVRTSPGLILPENEVSEYPATLHRRGMSEAASERTMTHAASLNHPPNRNKHNVFSRRQR